MKTFMTTAFGMTAALCACTGQPTGYTVEGEFADSIHHGKTIYIANYDDQSYMDSTVVDGCKFTFTGVADTTINLCRIHIPGSRQFANFILENGNIQVNFDKPNSPTGSPLNDEMTAVVAIEDTLRIQLTAAQKAIFEQNTDQTEARTQWMEEYTNKWVPELQAILAGISQKHGNDAVGLYLLYSPIMGSLNEEKQLEIIETFGPKLKATQTVASKLKTAQAAKQTAEGMPYTDIKGVDAEGNPIALSDFVGKGNYVLVDMWASWCGPCKAEIPNLAKLNKQFGKKGLTVLGVYVWDKPENLAPAMEKEGITWPQIVDENKEATEAYGVKGIPAIMLIGPDGTILKRGLRGQEMIKTVEEYLNK